MASPPIILDWTSERLRAWVVSPAQSPRAVTLEGTDPVFPLVISMAERRLQLGKAGLSLMRLQPQQVADCYVPYLGMDRSWRNGRHTLDARDALVFTLQKLRDKLPGKSLFHVVPSYWIREQAALLEDLTRQTGFRSLGSIPRGLALSGLAPGLTIDVDSYAVTLSGGRQNVRTGSLQHDQTQTLKELALPIWAERIGSLIASRCLRNCRRDPRAHPETDQQLYEQVMTKLYDWASHQDTRVQLKHREWQDDVLVPGVEVQAVCAPLAERIAGLVMQKKDAEGWYLSHEATRLPGLPQALYQGSMNQRSVSVLPQELMPQVLTSWVYQIDQGVLQAPQFADAMPAISEVTAERQPDTLPFPRKTRK